MKLRHKGEVEKIEAQMAPMIDVVFQLLIFFMLTLKILAPEGDFNINMPIGQAAEQESQELNLDIKVRLLANADGTLQNVVIGKRELGNDPAVFDRLNSTILGMVGRPGDRASDDMEVEIDADYGLHYAYTIQAISACTGKLGPDGTPIRYVDKIKFAKPRPPAGA